MCISVGGGGGGGGSFSENLAYELNEWSLSLKVFQMSETSKQIVANRALPYSLLPQLSSEYQHANQHAVERQFRGC